MSSVLKVDNIEKYYGSKANLTKAIDRISFEVEEGEFPCLKSLQADNKVMTIAPIAQYLQKRIFSTSSFEMSEQVFCAKIANG